MANQDDVRAIALSLPGAQEEAGHFKFNVENKGKPKGFAWVWLERVHPKKARVPCPDVLAVRVRGRTEKLALLASDKEVFFTEPHYDGFPAVLVRLEAVGVAQLRELLTEAWRCQAPAGAQGASAAVQDERLATEPAATKKPAATEKPAATTKPAASTTAATKKPTTSKPAMSASQPASSAKEPAAKKPAAKKPAAATATATAKPTAAAKKLAAKKPAAATATATAKPTAAAKKPAATKKPRR